MLDNVADGIVTAGEGGLIESFNRSARALFGYREEEVIGQPFELAMVAPEPREEFRDVSATAPRCCRPSRRRSGQADDRDARAAARTAPRLPWRWSTARCGSAIAILTLAFVRDVSERKAYTEALEHQALHDALTGLANRTLFGEHVLRLDRARPSAHDEPRAVLVMDLDGFKQVNDTLGHEHGDALLKQVAERLRGALRDTDTVARLGGDEFGILPGGRDRPGGGGGGRLEDPSRLASTAFMVTRRGRSRVARASASPCFPSTAGPPPSCCRGADAAMYVAKRSGQRPRRLRRRPRRTRRARRLALLVDLRQCIARDELVLHYQPKIDLATRAGLPASRRSFAGSTRPRVC